ncbi:MAG: flagellar basal body rod protein FlgB [Armatimonadetes bacterium]|nr:flagellar basal body rod protein FlgB [Armatimonadota bacterium]NIM24382.1 flagellar basal body rod protein FlgB [Armatimonadota bacterium]NIM68251.1 flagellar basal body rod protein FlgB [Armatimonadota bacterium]NIM75152.1 flagellar basal body rod protein FlgB [Armatimonadota bacterium]NIN06456.1 flagellar basal body rod protein FlgB [Armatimonadota bacterium]
MSSDTLSDVASAALEKALDGTAARHRTLANNIANVDTPGFRRREVAFHDALRGALKSANDSEQTLARLKRVRPRKFVDRTRSARADGNTVNIETEMGELAKNTLEYEADVQLLLSKLRMLRTAISGGR